MKRKQILFLVWIIIAVVWSASLLAALAVPDVPLAVRTRFSVIVSFILGALADLAYLGYELWRRPSTAIPGTVSKSREERVRLRRRDLWNAIKEWAGDGARGVAIETGGETRISYTYPLAAEPTRLALEVRYCLSQNYPSLWDERERFVAANIEYSRKTFTTKEEMVASREALRDQYRTLEKHLKSEILDKHYSRLRC